MSRLLQIYSIVCVLLMFDYRPCDQCFSIFRRECSTLNLLVFHCFVILIVCFQAWTKIIHSHWNI